MTETRRKRKNPPGSRKMRARKRRRIVLIVEVVLLIGLAAAVLVASKFNKLNRDLDFNEKDVKINKEVQADSGLTGYMNIAFFGLDSRDSGNLGKGSRSDAIIVASINNDTHEIRMMSVYRDTYLNLSDDNYDKANSAYFRGGPMQAVNMLNMNLDLDLKEYVAVDFSALTEVVDMLGGIDLEITEEEMGHMNNYCIETSDVTGVKTEPLYQYGLVHLNGVQATSYARIRQTLGDDYARADRQRLVIEKLFEKIQKTDLLTLNSILDKVLPKVSTSLSSAEILDLAKYVLSYKMGPSGGFPFDKTTRILDGSGDCVIPAELASNVSKLHNFLFEKENYKPSNTVKGISEAISYETGIYEADAD